MDIERNVKQAATDVDAFLSTGHYVHDYEHPHQVAVEAPKATRRDFAKHYSQWKNFKVLFGAACASSFSLILLTVRLVVRA